MKKLLSFILAASLLLTLTACTGSRREKYTKTVYELFDTVISVTAYDESEQAFETHFEAFYKELEPYHQLCDIYHTYDGVVNLKTLNETAADKPVKVDKRLLALLRFGKEVYGKTDGRVNICLGAVLSLWHEQREKNSNTLPDRAALEEASKHTDINDLVLDEENGTVYFRDKALQLDAGAIAKGYAGEQLAAYAKEHLWSSALMNLGGNVITYGTKDDGSGWTVGIQNPQDPEGAFIKTLTLTDRAVVTSGDYQRYYEVDGKRYCHIIRPDTLMPADYVSSVTVICASSAMADALSTALFLMPAEEAIALVNSLENTEAVFVGKDGTVTASENVKQYEKG